MKFRCERGLLLDGLSAASRAVSSRGAALPVLSGLCLTLAGDHLRITGTDLDLTITVEKMVAGEEDGTVVVPSKWALDIVKALEDGAIHFETEGDEATIVGGSAKFEVNLIPAEEFPQPTTSAGETVTMSAEEFADGVRQVASAASTDESRPILTGVLMAAEGTGLRLVSTDSYRLAVRDLPGNAILAEGQNVLVPSRALQEVVRVLGGANELTLELGEREASFVVNDTRVVTRLIEGDFPNYRNLIPSSQPNRLSIEREALIRAVRRVKLMAREATPVRLTMRDGVVELNASLQDVGQAHEELEATYTGNELTVAFNPDYLLTGLEVTPGDEVSLETVDALKPALIRSNENTDFLYLLMPVRVS